MDSSTNSLLGKDHISTEFKQNCPDSNNLTRTNSQLIGELNFSLSRHTSHQLAQSRGELRSQSRPGNAGKRSRVVVVTGKLTPSERRILFTKWTGQAWQEVSRQLKDTIVRSFVKCGKDWGTR